MAKQIMRYRVTITSLPVGHGFRVHLSSTKANALAMAARFRSKGDTVRITKLAKPRSA